MVAKREHLKPDEEQKWYMIPSGTYSYWILDTLGPKTFGPFKLKELKEEAMKLGISELIPALRNPKEYLKD